MDDFDPETAARAVTEALRPLGTSARAAQEKRYLKSDLEFFGVTVPELRRAVKAAARNYPGLDGPGMVAWADHLPEMSGVTLSEALRHLSSRDADRLRQLRGITGKKVPR